jgi:hypothetical protein
VDPILGRLVTTVAAFKANFDEWPSQARGTPVYVRGWALHLTQEEFDLLCQRLELRVKSAAEHSPVSVGGPSGVAHFGAWHDLRVDSWEHEVEPARHWLGLPEEARTIHGLPGVVLPASELPFSVVQLDRAQARKETMHIESKPWGVVGDFHVPTVKTLQPIERAGMIAAIQRLNDCSLSTAEQVADELLVG